VVETFQFQLGKTSPKKIKTYIKIILMQMIGQLPLLYIELAISFLIGRKRTVNFRNQRPRRHNCRLYNNHVKVKNNHVKVTGNHVMYDRGA